MHNVIADPSTAPPPPDPAGASFAAFTDEAQHNFGHVRGVGAVSVRLAEAAAVGAELAALRAASGVTECKWEQVRSARHGFAAGKLLAWALDQALAGRLWVDVLTWSTEDAAARREAVPALPRLRAMYARLLERVLNGRGAAESVWRVFPDEQQALDWQRIAAQMLSTGSIASITPVRSHEQPLVQLADLFVGLGIFSRSGYAAYLRWRSFPDVERNVPTGRFVAAETFPASLRYRCTLLDDFYTACVRRLPGISLRSHGGLRTYVAAAPVGFWWQDG